MLTVHIRNDAEQDRSLDFRGDVMTVGREATNDIQLQEINVSRRHARFVRRNDGVFVEDMGARYGTFVNGWRLEPLSAMRLQESDRIRIGDFIVHLTGEDLAEADEPEVTPAEDAAPALGPVRVPASKQVRLFITNDEREGEIRSFLIDRVPLILGSASDSAIILAHTSVSPHHAHIVYENGALKLRDLDSETGLWVDDQAYARVDLTIGQEFRIGKVDVRVAHPSETLSGANDSDDFDEDLDVASRNKGGSWRMLVVLLFVLLMAAVALYVYVNYVHRDTRVTDLRLPDVPTLQQPAAAPVPSRSGVPEAPPTPGAVDAPR